jgi:hypothetical protein
VNARRSIARPAVASSERVLGIYIGAMAIGEICLTFVSIVGGTIVYAGLLAAMLIHFAIHSDDRRASADHRAAGTTADALLALSFVPVARLVSISAPLEEASDSLEYLLVGVPLLAGIA